MRKEFVYFIGFVLFVVGCFWLLPNDQVYVDEQHGNVVCIVRNGDRVLGCIDESGEISSRHIDHTDWKEEKDSE